MESLQVKLLYTLKQSANDHLKNKQFQASSVYFNDILAKLDAAIEKIQSEEDMEKLIKEIKLPTHKNLSLCHLKLNQCQACVTQCQQALQLQPNCLKILYRIGKAHMGLKQYDSAQKYLKRGFANDPHEEQIQKALQQIQIARNSGKTQCQKQSILNLKKLIALILYWPLLILNKILQTIFGNSIKQKNQATIQSRKEKIINFDKEQ